MSTGAVATVGFTYDDRRRLIRENRYGVGQEPEYDLSYYYDNGGNRKLRADAINLIEARYYYDVRPEEPDPKTPQQYDSFNNRLEFYETYDVSDPKDPVLLSTTWYYYNESGNPTRVVTNQAGTNDYSATRMSYAWNGQAVTFMVNETWTWDGVPENCPTSYVPSGGREFRYDTARQRYFDQLFIFTYVKDWIRVPLGTTWTDYDGYQPYGDFTVQSEQAVNARSFELGTGTVDPWTGSGGGSTSHYHTDLIGTTRWMTDFNGSAASSATYTAFGEQIGATNPRYGYAGAWGYQSHDEFPYLHVGARYYDPATGRFLQRDPTGLRGGQNVYAYVDSAPTVAVDPDGLRSLVPGGPLPPRVRRPPGSGIPDTPGWDHTRPAPTGDFQTDFYNAIACAVGFPVLPPPRPRKQRPYYCDVDCPRYGTPHADMRRGR